MWIKCLQTKTRKPPDHHQNQNTTKPPQPEHHQNTTRTTRTAAAASCLPACLESILSLAAGMVCLPPWACLPSLSPILSSGCCVRLVSNLVFHLGCCVWACLPACLRSCLPACFLLSLLACLRLFNLVLSRLSLRWSGFDSSSLCYLMACIAI